MFRVLPTGATGIEGLQAKGLAGGVGVEVTVAVLVGVAERVTVGV